MKKILEEEILELECEIAFLAEQNRSLRRKLADIMVGDKEKQPPKTYKNKKRWAPISRMLMSPSLTIAEELMQNLLYNKTWEDIKEEAARKKIQKDREIQDAIDIYIEAAQLLRLKLQTGV